MIQAARAREPELEEQELLHALTGSDAVAEAMRQHLSG